MELSPYLMFDGQCEKAFSFYAKVLDGEVVAMLPHRGTPAADHVPEEWLDKILHARLEVGGQVIMASDAPPAYRQAPQGFAVSLSVQSPEETERIFNALAENGTVTMPLESTFFSARFGMLTDQYGIPWMINCEQPAES
jgi:PhnB protein